MLLRSLVVALVSSFALLGPGAHASAQAGSGNSTGGADTRIPIGTADRTTQLDCGETLTGVVRQPGVTARTLFQGVAGETVDLSLHARFGFPASFPIARVFAPDDSPVAVLIDNELETLVLPMSGEYAVEVSAATPGIYNLSLGCQAGAPLACGTLAMGSIDAPGELDYYSFDAQMNDFVQLVLTETGGFAGSTPRATLFAPSGAVLIEIDADNVIPMTLPETGTYLLRVRANNLLGQGTYNLGLGCLPPLGAILLTCGQPPENASTTQQGELRYFTFDGGVDDVVDVVIVGDSSEDTSVPQVRVFTPLGVLVETFTSDSVQSFILPETGLFTIEVRPADLADLGPFSIAIACRDPLGPVTDLDCGDMASASLGVADIDYYSFDGVAGDVAQLTLEVTAGFLEIASNPELRVFTPSGVDLGSFTADSENPVTLPETGQYSVRVNANTLTDSGSYAIDLVCLPPSGQSHVGDDSLLATTIVVAAEVDVYTFDGAMDEIVELSLVQTAGFSGTVARGELFTPSGSSLGAFNANSLNEFTLTETGSAATGNPYRVEVRASNNVGTGSYSFGLERRLHPAGFVDPDPQSPPLACGQVVSRSIGQAGEVDYYRFSGDAGDVVEVTLVETGGFSSSFPCAYVFAPSGVLVGSFCANELLPISLPESGQFAIRVNANTLIHTGTYNLGLSCRDPLGPVVADLVCGDVVSGQIARPAEVIYYTFEGETDDVVEVTLVETGGFSGSYPCAYVYAPGGVLVGSFCNNNIQALTLPESGQYSIRILTNTLVHTGTFNLGLSCRSPLGPVVDNLECGDVVGGQIAQAAEVIYYTFDGGANDVVEVTLVETSGFSGSYPCAYVYTPSGALVGSDCANALQALTLPESGQYSIRILTNTLVHTGTFNLGLSCRSPLGPVVDNLVCGDVVGGQITQAAEVIYYTFDGEADDVVEVTLVETGGFSGSYPCAYVYTPGGVLVDSFCNNNIQALTLPESGQYSIRILTNTLFHTGTFNLGLSCRSPLGPVVDNLVCGNVVGGQITQAAEVIYYTFDGEADDLVEVTLVETGGFSGSYPCAYVYTPGGVLVDSFCNNNIQALTLPESGQYSIRILTNTLFHTGTFNLGLSCRSPLGPVVDNLVCGDVVGGQITQAAEVIYYTFDGGADDVVEVTLVETSGFSGSYPCAYVYTPSGALVGSDCANALQALTLPESGQYSIRILTNTLVHTGTFNLGLSCRSPLGPVVDNLVCGDVVGGQITQAAEVIYYTFDGGVDDVVDVTLVETGGFSGSYPCAYVYSPSGVLVDSFCNNTIEQLTLPETGQYSIRILTNTLFHTGTFNLGLSCLP